MATAPAVAGTNESILVRVIKGEESPAQGLADAMGWLGKTETTIVKDVQSDPTAMTAVNTVIADGKAALTAAEGWAGTAMSGELGNLASEAAALVAKYAPKLIGSAAGAALGPLGAAGLTALQAIGEVAIAAVQHEVAAQTTGTSTVTPAA